MKKYQLRQIIREEISKAINNKELEEIRMFSLPDHNSKLYKEKITTNNVEMKAGDEFQSTYDMDNFLKVETDDKNKNNKEAKLYVNDTNLIGIKKKRYIDDILRKSKYEGDMTMIKINDSANKWKWKPKQGVAANLGGGARGGMKE